jgi:phage replication O-like protein O
VVDTLSNEIEGAIPQAEDGHVDIANEIVEALARTQLSGNEWRILWVIFRKTWGWHKKVDQISITQFQKATGLDRRNAHRTINDLVEKKIVVKIDNSRIITYGFQKDYTKWKDIVKNDNDAGKSRLSGQGKKKIVVKIDNRSLSKLTPTKETNKRNNIGRSRKQTDPRVKEFFDYWTETFQRETGQPYVFSFGKEGKLIKDLLAVHEFNTIQDMTRAFFRDEQSKRRGLTIGIFFQEINRLLGLRAMDPLEQAKRELRGEI